MKYYMIKKHLNFNYKMELKILATKISKNYLDISRGLKVGQRLLDAFSHLPDDSLWRLFFERPLTTKQLVPNSSVMTKIRNLL
jgi:hypothetical protein